MGFSITDNEMKFFKPIYFYFFLLMLIGGAVRAQEVEEPEETFPIELLDMRRPDESSPFFCPWNGVNLLETDGVKQRIAAANALPYPQTAPYERPDKTILKVVRKAAKSVRIHRNTPADMVTVKITPQPPFSLETCKEFTVDYTIKNTGKKLMSLYFPTTRHFDFEIKKADGTLLDQWSNERKFEPQEGVLMVNPEEKITFSATFSTRLMQAGETYILHSTMEGNPQYSHDVAIQVTP